MNIPQLHERLLILFMLLTTCHIKGHCYTSCFKHSRPSTSQFHVAQHNLAKSSRTDFIDPAMGIFLPFQCIFYFYSALLTTDN